MSKSTKIIIGFVISTSLVVFLFSRINIGSVIKSILEFNVFILIVLLLLYAVGMTLRTKRWQLLISQGMDLSFITVFKALSIGYMINNLLPAKVGELARMEYLKRKTRAGRSFLLGTIFIERILDVLLVLIIFGFSLIFSQTGRDVFIHNKWGFVIMFVVIGLFFYLMIKPRIITRLLSILPLKIRQIIENVIKSFTDSINFIKDRILLLKVLLYSILIWSLTLFMSFLILRGLNVSLSFYGYFFVVAVGVLGLIIPSTSGGIGVFHAVTTAALVMLGVEPDKALAYAIIAHAFDFFPSIIIGLMVSLHEGIKIKSLYNVSGSGQKNIKL